MKRTVIFVAGTLIIALALTAYAKKQISTSQSEQVNAKPCQVWALIADADHWADWNPAVKSAKLIKGDGSSVGSKVKFTPVIGDKKSPAPITLTLEKSEKPNLLEYSAGMAGMKIVFGFSIEQKSQDCPDCKPCGCKDDCKCPKTCPGLTVTSYETITGAGAGIFKTIFSQEGLDKEHRTWVEAIKEKLEK